MLNIDFIHYKVKSLVNFIDKHEYCNSIAKTIIYDLRKIIE